MLAAALWLLFGWASNVWPETDESLHFEQAAMLVVLIIASVLFFKEAT